MDVLHEVSSWRVGHDKAHVVGRLEAAVQVDQEGVTGRVDHLKDPFLTQQAEHRDQFKQTNYPEGFPVTSSSFQGQQIQSTVSSRPGDHGGHRAPKNLECYRDYSVTWALTEFCL